MTASTHQFGDFELDPSRFELRRNDRVVKLERIPMELLILLLERQGSLLERQGSVVTRQEIVDRLWGKDVFVDTEHGINVPEPGTLGLLGAGLVGIAGLARRRFLS